MPFGALLVVVRCSCFWDLFESRAVRLMQVDREAGGRVRRLHPSARRFQTDPEASRAPGVAARTHRDRRGT